MVRVVGLVDDWQCQGFLVVVPSRLIMASYILYRRKWNLPAVGSPFTVHWCGLLHMRCG